MTEQAQTEGIQHEVQMVAKDAIGLVVNGQASRDMAIGYIREIKQTSKRVTDYFGPLKKSAHETWKAIVAKEKELLEPLDMAERKAKIAVSTYDQEQEAVRLAEQRRLQAEADEKARRERERLEKEAAKLKTEAKREERLEAAAAVVAPTVEVAPAIEKQAGESTRKVWKARLVSIEALTGLPAGDVRLSFVEFDQAAANKFATATKGVVKVPGVEFICESVMALRA